MNNEQIKKFKCDFFKESSVVMYVIMSLCIFNNILIIFDFNNKDAKNFEVIATMVGLLGVLIGFLITSFSITITSISGRLSDEPDVEKRAKLNAYWKYLIDTFKYVLYPYIAVLGIFCLLLTTIKYLKYLNFVIPFVLLVTCYLLYHSVTFVIIYLRNQFAED